MWNANANDAGYAAFAQSLEDQWEDEFVAGRVIWRVTNEGGRFSGYAVDVNGVPAFLDVSKAAWFSQPERDASGKRIALSVEAINGNGSLIVDARAPLRRLLRAQDVVQDYLPGATPWCLAMDHDGQSLIFPHVGQQFIQVPLEEAAEVAMVAGIDPRPDALTGRFWQVRMLEWRPDIIIKRCFSFNRPPLERRPGAGIAAPLQVLPD